MTNLPLSISGTNLVLAETLTKPKVKTVAGVTTTTPGHPYHCFRIPPAANFGTGVPWPALNKDLPTSVEIDGLVIPLEAGFTAAEVTDRVTKKVTHKDPRPKVSAKGTALFPSIGEEKAYSVNISLRKDGTWNITISVNGTRSASPESGMARADANQAALRAFMGL